MPKIIMGVQAARRAQKLVPRGKTQIFITPGWEEPPARVGANMVTDTKRKAKRLQRA